MRVWIKVLIRVKYYKKYFKMNREYDKPDDPDMNGPNWDFPCPPFKPGVGPL